VSILTLTDGPDPNVFGAGFARDNMPLPIQITNAAGKSEYKYLIRSTNQGAGMIDALINAGEIPKEGVITTLFRFDGGDVTTGRGFLFVTDDFYRRNLEQVGLNEQQINTELKNYLGADADHILKWTKAPPAAPLWRGVWSS
jgi:hypothetical protein